MQRLSKFLTQNMNEDETEWENKLEFVNGEVG